MGISGRPAEFDDKKIRRANIIGCRILLLRLREIHGSSPAQPEPDIIDIVPAVVKNFATGDTRAEARFLRYRTDENGRRIPRVDEIKHVVATRFDVTTINLDSRSRKAAYVWPRQIAMFLASKITLRSLPDIGRRFGGRDHTTVLHAVKKIERLVLGNPETADLIDELKEQLNENDRAAVSPTPDTDPAHQAAV